jgi:hypothetical protein
MMRMRFSLLGRAVALLAVVVIVVLYMWRP